MFAKREQTFCLRYIGHRVNFSMQPQRQTEFNGREAPLRSK
jgi:hypothetical protein